MNITTRKGWLALLLTTGMVYGLGACNPTVTIQQPPLVDCDLGANACGEVCVDLESDPNNCGGCGIGCEAAEQCVAGQCVFGDSNCGLHDTDCGSYCTDLSSDSSNCGACGIRCGFGEICDGGGCTVNTTECPFQGDVRCDGVCSDLWSDANNCGGCGIACGPGGLCDAGTCQLSGCQDPGVCGSCDMLTMPSEVPVSYQGEAPTTNALEPDCAAPGSPETTLLYTAPVNGTYVFDTLGSPHDTALYVIETNGCGQIACNDDAPELLTSEVTVSLAQGQQVLVVVDGYGGGNGESHLNVALQ